MQMNELVVLENEQTLTGGDCMKVINVDKNGNVIEDLSKMKIPRELQIKVIKIMRNGNEVN